MKAIDAAYAVLRDEGRPLHYRELTERVLQQGLWETTGKTPWDTINARLSVDLNEHGSASRFRRTAPGIWAVNDGTASERLSGSSENESRAGRLAATTRAASAMSFVDAAEQVLRSSESGPMHYRKITEAAIAEGLINPGGLTPATSMSAVIGTDIRRREARGEQPRFVRLGSGMIGLADPVPSTLAAEIERNNQDVREGLVARLKEGSPEAFEAVVEELLTALGFEEVERTPLSRDGGIDVRGTLVVGDVVRIRMAVQAKRWQNNVQRPVVQQVRGSLGAHEQGLIITTSDFSKSAREEAARADASPVALMNGDQLTDLLVENDIGVRRAPYDLLSLEDAWDPPE